MKFSMPILALLVAVLLVASQSLYTVDQKQYAIRFQLGGRMEKRWAATGLECDIAIPLSEERGREVAAAVGLTLPGITGILPSLVPAAALGVVIVMISATVYHLARAEFSSAAITAVSALVLPVLQRSGHRDGRA